MRRDLNQQTIQSIESTFRSFNQPIWIVTTQFQNRRSGLTATWIHQASIDREHPTVLLGLAPNHFTCEQLHQSGYCMLHLLMPNQAELAYQFARPSSRFRDKFADIKVEEYQFSFDSAELTLPMLTECHTAIACKTLATFQAGDRDYFLTDIIALPKSNEQPHLRESELFGGLTPSQLDELKTDLKKDVEIQRPMLSEWIGQLKNSKSEN